MSKSEIASNPLEFPDPMRFADEIEQIKKIKFNMDKERIVVTTDPLKKVKKTLDRFLGEQNSILRHTDKSLRQPCCV